jgi:DNA-binding PadR family transcriptional regulator
VKLTKNDLLVLGFLLERPMHGYEIGQALRGEGVEVWFEISTAAIYYSLNKLHRLGLIAEARARGSSGERTVYHVTQPGREQFLADMRDLLASSEPIRTEYDLGISLLNRLPRDQARPLLRRRVEFLGEWIAELEGRRESANVYPLQRAILDHSIASAQLDIDWLTDIAGQLDAAEDCDPFTGDLMTLRGDLQEFHLPDLVKLIASGKHSGTLVVTAGSLSRTMTFDQGRVHCVGSHVSGKPVVERARVLDDVYQLFRWQQGNYIFDQRGCPREGCAVLECDADSLILEGSRRLDSWEIIQTMIPASDTLLERRDLGSRDHDLELLDVERRILSIVDGSKDITMVARLAELTEFETSRILYGLYLVDLVQPADPDKRRLQRVFREFAELMCRSAIPLRASPEEANDCENEVNRRCRDLPVSIQDGHIDDRTDSNLTAAELAKLYRRFLQTQHNVLGEHFGKEVAQQLRDQVLGKISPSLRETLEQYELLSS